MSAPLLVVALAAGLVIGLLQALTSVQEATLTFVPKVGAMLAVFWATMSFMTALLVGFFQGQVLPAIAGG
jgi:flagellar biosynthetic protein FliQ